MNPAVVLTFIAFLIAGCASHGNWSKSDRGAWTTLDRVIGNNDKSYYLENWGDPISRRDIKFSDGNGNVGFTGEELGWLWKPDGSGPSDQPGQGWELFLEFNEQGKYRNWWAGSYHTSLKVSDVVATTRKFEYRFGKELLNELGCLLEQHYIDEKNNGSAEGGRFYGSNRPFALSP